MILGQRDSRWAAVKIGDRTIGEVGCVDTVLAEILGVTPDVFVSRMKAVAGFKGNLVIWAAIAKAFPGVSAYRYYGYNNTKVLAFVPNVVVEVPAGPIGGTGSHWVRYIGGQKLHDPWTARERSTADFPNPTGFTIIHGVTASIPQNPYTEHQALVDIKTTLEDSHKSDPDKMFLIREAVRKVGV